ncbi:MULTISPECIES: hypothetical protein [unclassified Paenibacillus]|uniref:hypothetical protein n=1 Tax=Paenibacillus TaxID=44249 RepID=UPI0004148D72|nr:MULTISPECIES: hypothetical protein [unclassified Paenibacillus]CDN41858.1 hypothetical protein BN871_AN_00190 [Paenibacillus sp. P22]
MRKAIRIAAAGVLVSSMAALGACAGPAKEKGNQMHGAGQSAVRGLERAGQETVRGVENAGRGVSQSARSGTRALERTGERITGYGMGVDGHHPYGASGYGMADGTTEIPSIDRNKKTTTYEHAGTTHGLGTSTYSLIGSSGLHSGGFSSHLQSRLKADGIEGVKVFVFDDHVILASSKRGMTSASYDPMQKKLLSGTAGFSGHGAENTKSAGTYGVKSVDASTLEEAKAKLKEYLGDQVDVDSIESSKAIELIDKLRSLLDQNGASAGTAGGSTTGSEEGTAGETTGEASEGTTASGNAGSATVSNKDAAKAGDLLAELLKMVGQQQR